MTKLNFGCGRPKRHLPGFVNIDIREDADLTMDVVEDTWPWGFNSIDRIESYHFMEHITEKQGRRIILKSFAILKSGGTFVAETPDLAALCAKYPQSTHMARWGIFGRPDDAQGMGHLWGYCAATWHFELSQAGFTNILTGPGTDYHHQQGIVSVRVEAQKP